jgi:hypothetical protein
MAVTVTYAYPVAGATAPTAAQALLVNSVTAQVNMADADTTATVTHNFGLAAADPANLFPLVDINVSSPGTVVPILSVVLTNTNAVVINKVSAAGSGGTYNVLIQKPHSITR